jgi:hypothetical protein
VFPPSPPPNHDKMWLQNQDQTRNIEAMVFMEKINKCWLKPLD